MCDVAYKPVLKRIIIPAEKASLVQGWVNVFLRKVNSQDGWKTTYRRHCIIREHIVHSGVGLVPA